MPSSTYIFDIDEPDFPKKVIQASHQQPILVDFWADWCSPCLFLAPNLEQVINELEGEVLLGKVEVDEGENMRLAGHYKLRGFPTVILFYKGEEIARFSSAQTISWLENWIDEHTQHL